MKDLLVERFDFWELRNIAARRPPINDLTGVVVAFLSHHQADLPGESPAAVRVCFHKLPAYGLGLLELAVLRKSLDLEKKERLGRRVLFEEVIEHFQGLCGLLMSQQILDQALEGAQVLRP